MECAFLALILYSINPTILPAWMWTTFWVCWFLVVILKAVSSIRES